MGFADAAPLQEFEGFGSNPGNLRMFAYVPEHLADGAPLVVALHGCGQNAAEFSHGTGWTTLADRYGFVVVYPEQRQANNANTCFTWFLAGDTARGGGEAFSIRQMVEHGIVKYGVDRRRVFVTGLSAGGAMAAVMLATYPETFAGGAIIAGLPYGCASSVQQAFEAMFTEQSSSARALGDRVRSASGHSGPWPTISVWHGSADAIVKPSNAEHIVQQWADVHGLSAAPSGSERIDGHMRRVWTDADGATLIEAFSIAGMAHGVPLGSVDGAEHCGEAGQYFIDAGLSSTHHIAHAWGLDENCVEISDAAAAEILTEPSRFRATALATADTAKPSSSAGAPAARSSPALLDPSHVIAAAFKSAGLPVPGQPAASGGSPRIDPASIIEAALKAAGLRR